MYVGSMCFLNYVRQYNVIFALPLKSNQCCTAASQCDTISHTSDKKKQELTSRECESIQRDKKGCNNLKRL